MHSVCARRAILRIQAENETSILQMNYFAKHGVGVCAAAGTGPHC